MISKDDDRQYIESLINNPHFFEAPSWTVDGIEVVFPLKRASPDRAHLLWQRRILEDILPDTPDADVAEKIPFHILDASLHDHYPQEHTSATTGNKYLSLKPLFVLTTERGVEVPIAFHVLPVKTTSKAVKINTFKLPTFNLLLTQVKDNGETELVLELLINFISKFTTPVAALDLAQRVFLSSLDSNWSPDSNTLKLSLGDTKALPPPFMEDAAKLFRRDLYTLAGANLSNSEFFTYINLLFAFHFGLYQPRLAKRLNPVIESIIQALDAPTSIQLDQLQDLERGETPETKFSKSINIRGPSGQGHRPIHKTASSHRCFNIMEIDLNKLHFSLILFHRIRELTKPYLLHKGETPESAIELTRWPSKIVRRLQEDSQFRTYLNRAALILAIRYNQDQLSRIDAQLPPTKFYDLSNGLIALKACYEIYNREAPTRADNNRAYQHGITVTRSLLRNDDYGIIKSRRGFGSFFEFGAGLIPLFLILILQGREKIRVEEFWSGLEEYGFNFADEEKQLLLDRLKAMALYERFSDAGEANYIRNILTTNG